MFLEATVERNPGLIAAAIEFHRSGQIGPNTYVLDIDRILRNAQLIAARAQELGLSLHVMTKQHGRNPFMALASIHGGIPDAVAIDVSEARLLHSHGVPLGHVGHLVQVPARDTEDVLEMDPDVVTVFSVEAARRIAETAGRHGRVQDILLRVWKPGDFIYPGQEGGFRIAGVVAAARLIAQLPGVRIVGVTSHPCLLWDEAAGAVRATGNLASVSTAAQTLREELGLELTEINAPSLTAVGTLELIAGAGATHGEPGSSLTGNTPLHAAGDQPETPAMVYVSEVSAIDEDLVRCFGGGFYARSRLANALIVERSGRRRMVAAQQLPPEAIDYYGTLHVPGGMRAHVGETVVFAFRAQVFVGRCQVAAAAGLETGRPELLGICDQHGNLLGLDQLPMGAKEAAGIVHERWDGYLQGTSERNLSGVSG